MYEKNEDKYEIIVKLIIPNTPIKPKSLDFKFK